MTFTIFLAGLIMMGVGAVWAIFAREEKIRPPVAVFTIGFMIVLAVLTCTVIDFLSLV